MASVLAPRDFAFALRRDGVGGLARLGDDHRHFILFDQRIAVAEFAGVIHLDRNPRQPLDHVFAGQSGVPTGAAGGDVQLAQIAELFIGDVHLLQKHFAGIEGDAAHRGVAHRPRLLIDFLEHEVLEAALFRHDGVPGNVLHLALHRLSIKVGKGHALGSEHREVAIAEEEQVAGVIENRGHVAGHKILVLAQPDHRRRAIARRNDLVGFRAADHREGEDSVQPLHRHAHGFFQRDLLVRIFQDEVLLDQVRDDLGIGLGLVGVAFFAQLLLQREVVLDDAVVDDHDGSAAVAMRVRVLLARAPVRCPAGVADAVGAVDVVVADHLFQVAQLAFGAANLQPIFSARQPRFPPSRSRDTQAGASHR